MVPTSIALGFSIVVTSTRQNAPCLALMSGTSAKGWPHTIYGTAQVLMAPTSFAVGKPMVAAA